MRGHHRAAAGAALALLAASPSQAADQPSPLGPPPSQQNTNVDAAGTADTSTTVLDDHNVQPILGKEVRSSTGEPMGRIINVIVDGSGRPRAAVIDFGGFLGVGSRKIVVDWNTLHFSAQGDGNDEITADLTRDQVKAAPEFQSGRPVVAVGALNSSGPEM